MKLSYPFRPPRGQVIVQKHTLLILLQHFLLIIEYQMIRPPTCPKAKAYSLSIKASQVLVCPGWLRWSYRVKVGYQHFSQCYGYHADCRAFNNIELGTLHLPKMLPNSESVEFKAPFPGRCIASEVPVAIGEGSRQEQIS